MEGPNQKAILREKQVIRERIWALLANKGVVRFPGPHGRIPNFTGAELCRGQLGKIELWGKAHAIKANPDSPQTAIRRLALEEGKVVYMAVPRLREAKCFWELDPRRLGNLSNAASIRGASARGRRVGLDAMRPIDLILCGSVAVNCRGQRLGKGGGYSDLEYALARQAGLISDRTLILTTVHPLQIVEEELPWQPHDITVDYIITPDEAIRTHPSEPRPGGIMWEFLDEEKIAAIPVLETIRAGLSQRRVKPRAGIEPSSN